MNNTHILRPGCNPLTTILVIIGFMVAWPLGLLMLAYVLWGDRLVELRWDAGAFRSNYRSFGYRDAPIASGNVAFDVPTLATWGGGISNFSTLTITNSTISGNTADENGGGIFNRGTNLTINSTISGITADGKGGGIFNVSGCISIEVNLIINSTIRYNRAGIGGGIFNGDRRGGRHLLTLVRRRREVDLLG